MSQAIVQALCSLPKETAESGLSPHVLVRESGFGSARPDVSEGDIETYLREHPELVEAWVAYSENKRTSSGWYLASPARGLDGPNGWRVGYYTPQDRQRELVFRDPVTACAAFIIREAKAISAEVG